MYRDDLEALRNRLEAARRELVAERQRREDAEARAEQARLISRYLNPHPLPAIAVLGALLLGALLAAPLVLYHADRQSSAEARANRLAGEAVALVDQAERSRHSLGRCMEASPRAYASQGPAWVHEGMTPVLDQLLACQREHGAAGPVYLKGVVRRGRLTSGALLGGTFGGDAGECILDAAGQARFHYPPLANANVPFHYAVYPPAP